MESTPFLDAFLQFNKAPRRFIQDLSGSGSRQIIPAGSQIFREGDRCGGIAFVLEEVIRVYRMAQTGREITEYEIERGETCILSGKGYPAYAAALTDVKMLIVPSHTFRNLSREHEVMRDFVFSLLSQRFAGVMALVEEVDFGRMDQRLADYLVEKAENGSDHAAHQVIAYDLGTSREIISRLLKEFEIRGTVELARNAIHLIG